MILNFITGWPMSTPRVNWINGLPAALLLWVVAVEAAPVAVGDQPDADFLEFLGTWTSGDERTKKWVDPFQLDEPVLSESGEPTDDRSARDQRDDPRQKQRQDDNPSREPSASPVRPGGGMKP